MKSKLLQKLDTQIYSLEYENELLRKQLEEAKKELRDHIHEAAQHGINMSKTLLDAVLVEQKLEKEKSQ